LIARLLVEKPDDVAGWSI